MKKSELKNYIRENIISTLSEDTEAEIEKTKELTSAIKDLENAKKEAGIEEDATPKGEDFFYDYLDIGMSYLEGFGKKHSLDDTQLEKLGKKIVDQLYKGDIGKAYDAIVNRDKLDTPGKPAFVKEEDDEPKAKDLKGEPLSKIGYKLADTQKEMKRVVKKYSAAEGDEKEKLKDRLRELNKIKKELESLLETKR